MEIPFANLLTLYFILLGPLKVFGIYGQATTHGDRAFRLHVANLSVGLATIVALALALLGGFLMSRFELSIGTLAIVMGIFLGHWAWGRSMGIEPPGEKVPNPENPSKILAITPIAFPGILNPQGIALLILSSSMVIESNDQSDMIVIISLLLGVMALNWISFVSVDALMKFPGRLVWMLLARTLGVVAAALSVQMIIFGLRDLGIVG